ncbi:translation initiation factor IF-2 subunit gamma [Candidatus Woesearchaeota archaeon]|nr:translation initiation factor IF-2 subunit gamma [Candidatus Woesearchaeota archaeon]
MAVVTTKKPSKAKTPTEKTEKKAVAKPVAVKESKKKQELSQHQPVVSIGLFGHVDHGKTTLTKALTGKWTDTHSEEMKRGITIRLGYADADFYKCSKCKGEEAYNISPTCATCGGKAAFLRKVSFIDAPGHESLMATMLSGASIIDGALLLVAANEDCPLPQTREHLMALEILGIKNIVIVQNKIDLVDETQAMKNYEQIKTFIKGTIAAQAPIIPVSAQHNVNIPALISAIEQTIPTPVRDITKDPLFFVARSFDINRPGAVIESLHGGVLGGALQQGVLREGEEIEIRPGFGIEKEGKKQWHPIITNITGLHSGGVTVKEVHPGGSFGIMTGLDPYYVKADSLTGNVVGKKGRLPDVWYTLTLQPQLLQRVVGTKEELQVEAIKKLEPLMLNVNSAVTVGLVTELRKDLVHARLKIPVCCSKDDRIVISRMLGNRWRLIGVAKIVSA